MSVMGIVLIALGVWLLIALTVHPLLRYRKNIETAATLKRYEEFKEQRDFESPEMVGKWGKL